MAIGVATMLVILCGTSTCDRPDYGCGSWPVVGFEKADAIYNRTVADPHQHAGLFTGFTIGADERAGGVKRYFLSRLESTGEREGTIGEYENKIHLPLIWTCTYGDISHDLGELRALRERFCSNFVTGSAWRGTYTCFETPNSPQLDPDGRGRVLESAGRLYVNLDGHGGLFNTGWTYEFICDLKQKFEWGATGGEFGWADPTWRGTAENLKADVNAVRCHLRPLTSQHSEGRPRARRGMSCTFPSTLQRRK